MYQCFLPNEAYDLAWFEDDSQSFAILSDTKSAKSENFVHPTFPLH